MCPGCMGVKAILIDHFWYDYTLVSAQPWDKSVKTLEKDREKDTKNNAVNSGRPFATHHIYFVCVNHCKSLTMRRGGDQSWLFPAAVGPGGHKGFIK